MTSPWSSLLAGLHAVALMVIGPVGPRRSDPTAQALALWDEFGSTLVRGARLTEGPSQRIQQALLTAYAEALLAGRFRSGTPAGATGSGSVSPWRPIAVGLTVIALLLGVTSVALAESGPGQALYPARLALETLTLPGPDSSDRVSAQLQRLEVRIREAVEAAADSDERALDDALSAYRKTVAEIAELSVRYPDTRSAVARSLRKDLRSLEALDDRIPSRLRAPAELAIAATQQARVLIGDEVLRHSPALSRVRTATPPGHPRLGPLAVPSIVHR